MRSSERAFALALVLGCAWSARAEAQTPVQGFSVDRFYRSAPGGGWLVMDDLSMHGPLGGTLSVASGYAHDPLRVATVDGSERLPVVEEQSFATVGMAATYSRFRLYLDFKRPITSSGTGGTVGNYTLTAPTTNLSTNPDALADTRIGFDLRLLGEATSPFRLGAGVQLFVPSGDRADYDTDGTYRVMGRLLFAGDVGPFAYAGQIGVHVRPLDDSPAPGSPQGDELLFGVAGGAKIPLGGVERIRIVVGPEIYGETAFRSFLGTTATGLEALLSGRLEETNEDAPRLHVKLGVGGGLDPHFGAPAWRAVFAIEVFDRAAGPPAPPATH